MSVRARVVGRTVLFWAGLVACLLAGERVFDVIARRDPVPKANWLFAREGGRYGLAVIGSSRAYGTTDVGLLDSALGVRGINLAIDGASFAELALVLERFLQRNTVEHLLVEVDPFGLDSAAFTNPFSAYPYLPYIREDVVQAHLRGYFGAPRTTAWRWVPFLRYAEFNEQIGLGAVYSLVRRLQPEFDSTGTRLIDRPFFDPSLDSGVIDIRISASRVAALEQLLALATRSGTRVTFYMAPEFAPLAPLRRHRDDALAFYRDFAARRGIEFLEFGPDGLWTDQSLFKDAEHLNRAGAKVFSLELAARLARGPGAAQSARSSPATNAAAGQ